MREIQLSGRGVALIDDEDLEKVSAFKWTVAVIGEHSQRRYAKTTTLTTPNGACALMHRLILDSPPCMDVDHINHDGLDNRKSNLRVCTRSQNLWNRRKTNRPSSSIYKVVYWENLNKKWRAQLGVNQRKISLGRFESEVEAAIAYDRAAIQHFGEFAFLNFPK